MAQTNWPMVATSYIVMYKDNEDKEATKTAIKFFEYGFAHDVEAEALDYVPLTDAQKREVKKTLATVK